MPEPEIQEIYVQPGESHLVSQPAVLRTVLGSCVGVTFLVPRLGIAALCHPMLPQCPQAKLAGISVHSGRRYVDFAIRDMARRLDARGAARAEAVVKLFGGNDVLPIVAGARPSVGKLNSQAAIRVLAEEGFALAASCVGGDAGMHISFDSCTGDVFLRRLDTGPHQKPRKSFQIARRPDPSR